MSNAHASRTHTDQSRLAKSRLLVADAIQRDRQADDPPHPHDAATWLLEQLQALGWKTPPDPDTPPLRPDQPADNNSPGRQAFRAGLCRRYGHPDPAAPTCPRCGDPRP